jgi:hypothetical protein
LWRKRTKWQTARERGQICARERQCYKIGAELVGEYREKVRVEQTHKANSRPEIATDTEAGASTHDGGLPAGCIRSGGIEAENELTSVGLP